MCERTDNWQGSNWARQSTRLAIYLRDGMACVYCGKSIEDVGHPIQLSLDHVRPVSKGGSNDPKNLVTACLGCNCGHGSQNIQRWCFFMDDYMHRPIGKTRSIVNKVRRRKLPRKQALALLRRREGAKVTTAQVVGKMAG